MRKLFNHNTLKAIVFMAILPMTAKTQAVLYNPQTLYDSPGGLYDQGTIREMNIQFYDANYHSTLVNSFFNYPSYRIPAVVSIDGISYDSVGVRYKGNSTFCLPNDDGNPKVPYNLDANYWISGQKIADYKKLKFANAWMDPTFAKEITATNIYQKYMPSPEVSLLKVKVQGNYLGLYVNTESINKQFMEKHFGEKDGVLFKCDPAGMFCGEEVEGEPNLHYLGEDSTNYYTSYNLKSDNGGWDKLMELISALNFNTEELGEFLNIDRVLWAFAVNTVIANYDTYNGYYVHNYYHDAISELDRFIKNYPKDKRLNYAHFLLAMCYYEQIVDEKKDLGPLLNAQKEFKFIIKNYPNSDFALDSKFKLDFINDVLASKEIYLGRYYIKKEKWIAAINRFKQVVEHYDSTAYVEEALHRLVELHYRIGLLDESKKYANLLGYNYQSSKWYEASYSIFNKDYENPAKKINKKKGNFIIRKFKSLFE